jgi:hypothetical protein
MKLQTARQARNENPQEFADRCRALSQKIICKVVDHVSQRVDNENAERLLLASFVAALSVESVRQTHFVNPLNLSQNLGIALAVLETERQEKANSSFYTKF